MGERWLTPGVRGIGTASLLADVGHEIPTALLPSLLTSTLGAPASALGLIEGVSDGLAGIARLGGGALADDPHRRRSVAVGGYTTTAVLAAITGAATAVWQVGAAAGRGVDRTRAAGAGPQRAAGRRRAPVAPTAGPTASNGRWTTSAPSSARCSPSAWSPRSGSGGRSACPSSPACSPPLAIVYAIRHTPTPQHSRARPDPAPGPAGARAAGAAAACSSGSAAFEVGNVAATLLILRATELLDPGRGHDRRHQLALVLYVAYNVAATAHQRRRRPAHRPPHRPPCVLTIGVAAVRRSPTSASPSTPPAGSPCCPWFVAAGIGIGCVETARARRRRHRHPRPAARLRLRAAGGHPEPRQPRSPPRPPGSSGLPPGPAGRSP